MYKGSTVALVHHWLTGIRGGEKVLEQFCKLFPNSDISTLIDDIEERPKWLEGRGVHTSIIQSVPNAAKRFKTLLPIFPFAIGMTLRTRKDAKLVLSTDASLIKGLKFPRDAVHICYCHSPPRYLWDMQKTYMEQSSDMSFVARTVLKLITPYLRAFDRRAARKVTHFIANSKFVAKRIKRSYGRDSTVIYPPVACHDFRYQVEKDDFYLVVSELVPYKRIDIAVEAFNKSGKKLVIIGAGDERDRLEAMANDNITFLGRQPFSVLVDHYARCRAFIFPGIEDFGITPLEAQASGSPVIAYGKGGALETVIPHETGIFFDRQDADSLNEAVEALEGEEGITAENCRINALNFDEERFRNEMESFINYCYVVDGNPYLYPTMVREYSLAR